MGVILWFINQQTYLGGPILQAYLTKTSSKSHEESWGTVRNRDNWDFWGVVTSGKRAWYDAIGGYPSLTMKRFTFVASGDEFCHEPWQWLTYARAHWFSACLIVTSLIKYSDPGNKGCKCFVANTKKKGLLVLSLTIGEQVFCWPVVIAPMSLCTCTTMYQDPAWNMEYDHPIMIGDSFRC